MSLGNPTGPQAFSSPWSSGSVTGTIVNINRSDNSVQVRYDGYHDDKGNIPDEKTKWVKCLSQFHSGIQGATGTHNYYVGAKVAMSSCGNFIMGAITGYDSHGDKKDGGDQSEDQTPNVPRQVRGSKGISEVPAGEGSDQTEKGTRGVEKTDKNYDDEQPEKVYDYSKGKAPFDKGDKAKFTDLMSIGIDKLKQGSDILSTIDGMDGNVSGAIQAGTKIIKNLRNNGYADALSVMGGAASEGTAQVAQYFGAMSFEELIQALLRLLAAAKAVSALKSGDDPGALFDVPECLQDQYFNVGTDVIDQLSDLRQSYRDLTASGVDSRAVIIGIQAEFAVGFAVAVTNAISYVSRIVSSAGTPQILVSGTNSTDRLMSLVSAISQVGAQAGLTPQAIGSTGGGAIGSIISSGVSALTSLASGGTPSFGGFGSAQQMMEKMNTFRGDAEAMGEIMGGGKSIEESMTKIIMKFSKKKVNLDKKGFTS